MVRRCCVEGCNETDLSILSHRFPKPQKTAEKWRAALKISSISLDELQKGSFVVCTKHFKGRDYRNEVSNCLNTTAIPTLEDNSSNNERIVTTKGKEKPKELTQLRCHKSTPTATPEKRTILISEIINKRTAEKLSKVVSEIPIKRVKLESSIKSKGLIIAEEILLNDENNYILPNNEIEKAPSSENLASYEELPTIGEDAVKSDQLFLEDRSTMTESFEKVHQEVQANLEESPKSSDKDDKMIKLLYPKYAGLSKMELVKVLVERDLKISSLEEKEKQLEEILTNMI